MVLPKGKVEGGGKVTPGHCTMEEGSERAAYGIRSGRGGGCTLRSWMGKGLGRSWMGRGLGRSWMVRGLGRKAAQELNLPRALVSPSPDLSRAHFCVTIAAKAFSISSFFSFCWAFLRGFLARYSRPSRTWCKTNQTRLAPTYLRWECNAILRSQMKPLRFNWNRSDSTGIALIQLESL